MDILLNLCASSVLCGTYSLIFFIRKILMINFVKCHVFFWYQYVLQVYDKCIWNMCLKKNIIEMILWYIFKYNLFNLSCSNLLSTFPFLEFKNYYRVQALSPSFTKLNDHISHKWHLPSKFDNVRVPWIHELL